MNSAGTTSGGPKTGSTRTGSGVLTYVQRGPQWTKQMRASDYEAFAGKKVGFDATARRFHYKEVFYG